MMHLYDHPAFDRLPGDLPPLVAGWVEDLVRDSAHLFEIPEQPLDPILDALHKLIDASRRDLPELVTEEDWQEIWLWAHNTPREILLRMISQACMRHNAAKQRLERSYRRATPEQLKIIAEAQKEVGLNFSRFFNELTSWEADAIIKGVVLISEVQRLTGDRHFQLRDVRAAIRNHINVEQPRVPAQTSRRPAPSTPRDRPWPSTGNYSSNVPIEDVWYPRGE